MRRSFACALAAMTIVACAGDEADHPSETATEALRRHLDDLADGRAERAYSDLHPAQQRLVGEELYARCVLEVALEVDTVRIIETYEEERVIPGTETRARSTAVRAEVSFSTDGEPMASTETFNLFLVDGSWRFIIADPAPYLAGHCP